MDEEESMASAPPDQFPGVLCFPSLYSGQSSVDHISHFESALSSMVSSPSNTPRPCAAPHDAENVVIRELIGRLGSICNSGEISPRFHRYVGSAGTSWYTTPMSSPPKLGLSMADHQFQVRGNVPVLGNPAPTHLTPLAADPAFAERAARLSCFGGWNHGGGSSGQYALHEAGRLSRVSSSQSLIDCGGGGSQIGISENREIPMQEGSAQLPIEMMPKFSIGPSGSATPENGASESAREESSLRRMLSAGESNGKKRKVIPKGIAKDIPKVSEQNESNGKRSRSIDRRRTGNDDLKPKVEESTDSDGGQKEDNAKPTEPPKQDYIHVRARRGQATDSHSLAERVRRERINERMKFLQNLVPGCNMVVGKAVMLDEIINYVQSLQRQVEFLSMKLATLDPLLETSVDNLLHKDMQQSYGSVSHSSYSMEISNPAYPLFNPSLQLQGASSPQSIVTNGVGSHVLVNPSDAKLRRSLSMQQPTSEGFCDADFQLGNLREDGYLNAVQMGYGQEQASAFMP